MAELGAGLPPAPDDSARLVELAGHALRLVVKQNGGGAATLEEIEAMVPQGTKVEPLMRALVDRGVASHEGQDVYALIEAEEPSSGRPVAAAVLAAGDAAVDTWEDLSDDEVVDGEADEPQYTRAEPAPNQWGPALLEQHAERPTAEITRAMARTIGAEGIGAMVLAAIEDRDAPFVLRINP